ncbi:hypothetical protein [Hydrogenimonas urashimensis]|uniref:hypothetical protein n=1 Tax=Hydrogenimonas urashimensis TaxID=2740515 RepID=UPI001914E460|nr:hypothetical protein [Hydrogenimonas urashimensis]
METESMESSVKKLHFQTLFRKGRLNFLPISDDERIPNHIRRNRFFENNRPANVFIRPARRFTAITNGEPIGIDNTIRLKPARQKRFHRHTRPASTDG